MPELVAVTALLVAVAVLFTWPLARRLPSVATNPGDPLHLSWVLAWDLHALGHAPSRLFDANAFHPHRWTLAYSENLLGLVPLAAPIRLAGGGPMLVHNAVLFATFPLTGLGMFLLVRALTGVPGAAALAAVLYAFSPYRFGQLGHVQLLSHQWLPIMLLGAHRVVTGGGRWRDVALTAGAFVLQALSSGYYAYVAAIALGLFAVWVGAPTARPPLATIVRRATVAAACAAAILAPVALAYHRAGREVPLERARSEILHYAARPSAYVTAPPSHRWLGDATARFRRAEGELFPGGLALGMALGGALGLATRPVPPAGFGAPPFPADGGAASPRRGWPRLADRALAVGVVLVLAMLLVPGVAAIRIAGLPVAPRDFRIPLILLAVALLARRLARGGPAAIPGLRWLRRLGWPRVEGYYLGLVVVGVVCSFGPTLMAGDDAVVAVPLYREIARVVPGFDALRVPARFALLAGTGLTVLAGLGTARLVRRRTRLPRAVVLGALTGLALLEAWPAPLPFVDVVPGGAADRWLRTARPDGAVVMLPMYGPTQAHGEARRLIGSTLHWRPLVNGYASAFPPEYADTARVLNGFAGPEALARLRELGVRYVVVEWGAMPAEARRRARAGLRAPPPGVVEAAVLGDVTIYELTDADAAVTVTRARDPRRCAQPPPTGRPPR